MTADKVVINSANKFIEAIVFACLKPFGRAFSNRLFPPTLLLKYVILQKLLRINGHVPWPVHWTSQIKAADKITRGTRCPGLARFCYIDGRNGIIIGSNVWIGPRVSLISMNHDLNDYHKYRKAGPIVIGRDCWLGAGSIVLPNVRLGNHVIVAAGSVVTKSFEHDNILIGGNPARIIKRIGSYSEESGKREGSANLDIDKDLSYNLFAETSRGYLQK